MPHHLMRTLISNYPLLAAALAWVSAQVLKTLLTLIMTRKLVLERLFGPGGMPSAHSAGVCALSVAVARVEGIQSTLFALSIVLSCVVIYDAMGVRLHAGRQAKTLNKVVDALERDLEGDAPEDFGGFYDDGKDLKEVLGHTPLEVLGGALLGILVATTLRL